MLAIRRRNAYYEQAKVEGQLRQRISKLVQQKIRSDKFGNTSVDEWQALADSISLGAEGFEPVFKEFRFLDVDRRSNMMTGPFFTSASFPVPSTSSGQLMLAMMQLDLEDFSAVAKQDLGEGLLQLWFDTEAEEALIRVIPWQEVQGGEPTAFDMRAVDPSAFDVHPLPSYWAEKFCGPTVQSVVALNSRGLQSQAKNLEALCWTLGEDASEWLQVLVTLYAREVPYTLRGPVSLLGTFYPIQYSAEEVGLKCLLSIADWGSSGGAQIFYRPKSALEAPEFTFWSCVR